MTDRNPDVVCSYCLRYLHSISRASLDRREPAAEKAMTTEHFCDAKCRSNYIKNDFEPKGGYRK